MCASVQGPDPIVLCAYHAEAAMLARGRAVRQSKLLFYAKMAEKALQVCAAQNQLMAQLHASRTHCS